MIYFLKKYYNDKYWMVFVCPSNMKECTKFLCANETSKNIRDVDEDCFRDSDNQINAFLSLFRDEKYELPNIEIEKIDDMNFKIKIFVNREQEFYLLTAMNSVIYRFACNKEIDFRPQLVSKDKACIDYVIDENDPKWDELINWD